MLVYHGSQEMIERPVFGKGKENNDYGLGFYCTESMELAKEWACPVQKNGFANCYELSTLGFNILNLTEDRYHVLNWLALLLKNRQLDLSPAKTLAVEAQSYIIENFLPDIKEYDLIIGNRADDRYFAFAKDFVSGGISVGQLAKAMKFGNLGQQIVLKSKKAFEQIRFLQAQEVDGSVYYSKRIEREKEAQNAFEGLHRESVDLNQDLFVLDIIRQGVKNDDPRLR